MKILHIIESLECGGAEKVLINLANEQSKSDNVYICCVKREGELIGEVSNRIKVLSLNNREGNDIFLPKKLRTLISENKIDVVHSHNWGLYLDCILSVIISKDVKLVHTVHGPYIPYGNSLMSFIKKYIRKTLEVLLTYRVCKIITVSNLLSPYVNKHLLIHQNKIITIKNGINNIEPKSEKYIDNGLTKFITVGRLTDIKNQKMMIEAFSQSLGENKKLFLEIIGDGELRDELEEQVKRLRIEDSVKFLGYRNDIEQLVNKSDIFILSSNYEGISISVLEAMRSSLPIISTDVGGVSETVKDGINGILVEKNNTQEMSDAILKLSNNKKLIESMGEASFVLFNDNFTLDKMSSSYNEVYKLCL